MYSKHNEHTTIKSLAKTTDLYLDWIALSPLALRQEARSADRQSHHLAARIVSAVRSIPITMHRLKPSF